MAVSGPPRRAADPAWEAAVARELQPRIRYVVAHRLPAALAHLIDDIVHDTLVAIIEAIRDDRLREADSLQAFAQATARNVTSNWVRRENRRQTAPLDESFPAETTGTLELLVKEEQTAEITRCLPRLSARDREILELAYGNGLTPAEIAERLGIEPATARRWKSRALGRLKKLCHDDS